MTPRWLIGACSLRRRSRFAATPTASRSNATSSAADMRLFRVTAAGNLTLESISLSGGIARGANGIAARRKRRRWPRRRRLQPRHRCRSSPARSMRIKRSAAMAGAWRSRWRGTGGAIYNDDGTLSITQRHVLRQCAFTADLASSRSQQLRRRDLQQERVAHRSQQHASPIARPSTGRGIYVLGRGRHRDGRNSELDHRPKRCQRVSCASF